MDQGFRSGVFASNERRAALLAVQRLEFARWLVEHRRVSDLDDGHPRRPEGESGRCLHCGIPLLGRETVICAVCRLARRDGEW